MKMVVHFIFEDRKDLVASAMTGEEGGVGIGRGESLGQCGEVGL
jgi:hypothetical protein